MLRGIVGPRETAHNKKRRKYITKNLKFVLLNKYYKNDKT